MSDLSLNDSKFMQVSHLQHIPYSNSAPRLSNDSQRVFSDNKPGQGSKQISSAINDMTVREISEQQFI